MKYGGGSGMGRLEKAKKTTKKSTKGKPAKKKAKKGY
jgi:hypothetical protein